MASVPFNNLITFSRGSNATLIGSNGLIQWAPNNLVQQSESFDNTYWTLAQATVTANNTVAPDGTTTADLLLPTAVVNLHGISRVVSVAAGSYTISFYAKAQNASKIMLWSGAFGYGFDLTDGTMSAVTGYTAPTSYAITALANGWYRCSITTSSAPSEASVFILQSFAGASYLGSVTQGIFLWGAQLELGTTATTYNPTTVKNLLGYSEAFDNAAWTKSNSSIVTGAQANPVNGAFNAQKLMENTAAATHYALQAVSVLAAPYALSVYAKAGERSFVSLGFDGLNAWFNLSTGVLGTVEAGLTASISSVGSGWYRCSVFRTVAVAGSKSCVVYTANANGAVSYTGDGNSGIYIYGAQLSDSASLDPYVPTPGAAPSSTAYYGPRFDYDPLTLAPKGILVEEARTNLTFHSGFTTANWTASGGTLANTGKTSPDGTSQMGLFTEDTATSAHQTFVTSLPPVFTLGTTYTGSVYLAAGTRRYVVVQSGGNGSGWGVTVDTQTWTITGDFATGGCAFTSASIVNAGNGIYRVTVTGVQNTGGGTSAYVVVGGSLIADALNAGTSYLGNGSTFYAWGAQLEAGAFATSYIPTIASTVTRSADIATITGSLFSQWYGQNEGSFVAIFTAAQNTFTTYIAASNGVVAQNSMHMDNDGSGNMRVAYYSGSSAVALLSLGATGTVGTINILGTAYRANDFAASRNGGTVVSDTAGAVPVGVNRLNIGADPSGAAVNVSNGHIRYAAYYPVRLADFQLQALTELPLVPTLNLDFLNNSYEA